MCCDDCGNKADKYFNCDGNKCCPECADKWEQQEAVRRQDDEKE